MTFVFKVLRAWLLGYIHGGCYATWWMLRQCWGWEGVGWDANVSCTCTHGGCYANAGAGVGWGGMQMFGACAHMVAATPMLGLGWGGMHMHAADGEATKFSWRDIWNPLKLPGDLGRRDLVVSNICYFHPYLGKWSNLINIFQLDWNHHPAGPPPTFSRRQGPGTETNKKGVQGGKTGNTDLLGMSPWNFGNGWMEIDGNSK